MSAFRDYLSSVVSVHWGNSPFQFFFYLGILLVLLLEKRREVRVVLGWLPLLFLLVIYNPLFGQVLSRVIPSKSWAYLSRLFTFVPLFYVVAHGAVLLLSRLKDGAKFLCVCLLGAVIALSGESVYHQYWMRPAANAEKAQTDAVEMVEHSRGIRIDIHQINALKQDELIRRQLLKAETCGCFYIESPAMRGLLRKLRCSDYKTLVAASSIIRPGVARSGMMREYIHRFHHPETVDYKHPLLKELLSETYGVMIYQEDVLKVGHYFAGLDLADADVLRRMMGHKMRDKSEFEEVTKRFFDNCKAKGYPDALVSELWRQIESFSGYSFSKAHSASYAVESYQSLYLKSHYPLEFQVAVINNFGGFYQTWFYFNEARRMGAKIHLPCVNRSDYLTTLNGRTIFMGFVHLQGIEQRFVEYFVAERKARGPFKSLEDFVARVPFTLEQLVLLIRGGAFNFTKQTKAELLWQAHLNKGQGKKEQPETLFPLENQHFEFPDFQANALQNAYDEIELYGFPVSLTWFDLLKTKFRGELMASQMLHFVGKSYRMLGKLVTVKYVRTCKGETMALGTFVDVTGEAFDTVHFPQVLKAWPFQGDGVYLLLGKVTEEFGQPSLEVEKMDRMGYKSLE